MKKTAPEVSFIIVHYHAKNVLLSCISSILKSRPKVPYEILVVDNDETVNIAKTLYERFPMVTYIKSPKNKGFGGGINLGAAKARGRILCLLNPDTIVLGSGVDALYDFINQKKNVGVASAVMLDKNQTMPILQGAGKLTPLTAIFTYSFIHKLSPNNPIAKRYWVKRWDVKDEKHSPSVPLGMAMIKRSIFENIGGFDESFFLYYEDFDLNKRIEDSGYKNYLYGNAKVIHLGGKGGTEVVSNLSGIYKKSRFYYFKKHYGFFAALLVDSILRVNKTTALIIVVFMLILFFGKILTIFLF